MTGYTRQDLNDNIATGEVIEAADLDNEFDAIVAAFNSTSGHSHNGSSAEGAPITVIGPSQDVVVTENQLRPRETNLVNLGTATFGFRNGYFTGPVAAPSFVGAVTGNASTATTLATPRNFSITGGATAAAVAFNGSANVALNVTGLDASSLNTGTVPAGRLPTEQNPTTFRNGPPGVVIQRNNSTINAVIEYQTTDGSIYAGKSSTNSFSIGTGADLNNPANRNFSVGAASGNVIWSGVATGDGSGITNMAAGALASGTVHDDRLSGNYGFNALSLTGSADIANNLTVGGTITGPSRIVATTGGSIATPTFGFSGTGGGGIGWHVYAISSSPLMGVVDGISRFEINSSTITATSGVVFTGDGSGLWSLNGSNIGSGTIPSGRLSGSYTSIVGTGALNAGSITSGFGSINIGSSTFTGNGSGLTSLNMDNASSGTLPQARLPTIPTANLPTTTQARDWTLDRVSEASVGVVGTYALLRADGAARPVTPGQTRAGSALAYSNSASGGATAPSGTWRCMGEIGSGDTSSLFLRIS